MDRLISIFLVILFCGSAVGSRTDQLFLDIVNVHATLAAADGVCSAMVEPQNYPCQEHEVTTRDGYILSLQNIPYGQSGKTSGKRPPVLLQHGLLMDAITWLLSPPDQSLALLLADNGFDVWLVNTRGTKYSRGHKSLGPDDAAFWNWSWDELVAYDLPATFKYVHDQTGQKFHYVGHSLGTLIALAAFSNGQLVNMLRSAAMLCPIAYLGQLTSPLARAGAENLLAETLYWLKIHEFNPIGDAVINLLLHICKEKGVDCTHLLTSFTVIREGTIKKYDYGDEKENRKHYGTPTPPSYNMTNIPNDVPLFLAYGGADALSVSEDVKLLLDSLQDHEADKLVIEYREDYAHGDYVMAVNARQAVYDPFMAFLRLQ